MLWKGDPTHVSFVMSERAQLSAQRGLGVSDSTESFAINIWDEFEMLAPPPRATDVSGVPRRVNSGEQKLCFWPSSLRWH